MPGRRRARWQNRPMPRPIEALVHVDALAANLARRARGGAGGARLGGRQGRCLRPRHRQRLRRPAGRRRLRPARSRRGRAAARARLARPDPPSRRLLRARATSRPARAWASGTSFTAPRRSTGSPRTRPTRPHHVFLKMNSGMNRLGFAPAAFRAAWLRLDALAQVDEVTLMTHLADADAPRPGRRRRPGARRLRGRDRRPAGRALDLQQRRAAALRRAPRARLGRLGAAGHHALRLVARCGHAQRGAAGGCARR